MRRIAFLGRGVHTIPSYRRLLNRLTDDFSIHVFSETPIEESWKLLERKYHLRRGALRGFSLQWNAITLFFSLWFAHLRTPFHVIHAHSTFPTGLVATVFKKLFNVPVVVALDGGEGVFLPDVKFGDLHSQLRSRINRWILAQADAVTTLTKFHRDLVVKNLGVDRDIQVLHRGVDDSFSTKDSFGLPRKVRFLAVGYLSPVKDPEMLIKAFSIIASRIDCSLLVIGKDYMQGKAHQLVRQLELTEQVEFVESVPYHEMPSYYRRADILLVASRYESHGMMVVEAMASGVVVCGTCVGLLADLSGECCATVAARDYRALADKALSLVNNETLRQHMIAKGKEWTKINSLEKTVKSWRAIYNWLMKP